MAESEKDSLEMNSSQQEMAPFMEPAATPAARYWQAQRFAEAIHQKFEAHLAAGELDAIRQEFYVLARYYGRTLAILRHSLAKGREPLLRATLKNIIALHQPMHHMHDLSPSSAPVVLTMDSDTRHNLTEDLIIEVLEEAARSLSVSTITHRVNNQHVLARATTEIIEKHLENLMASGYVLPEAEGFARSKRAYDTINIDRKGLMALLGPDLYHVFQENGFHGLVDLASRKNAFQRFFTKLSGASATTADLFAAAARELTRLPQSTPHFSPWHHEEVIHSPHPRPYQHDAFAVFRGFGYKGQILEAPTGSGKTLIGMMCLDDWFHALSPGEAVLILVPTVNYQQQWVKELCHTPIGLRLTPDVIFTGTPTALEAERAKEGLAPAVVIMTYTALAQTGSGSGKGGFDQNSIEIFLQGSGIQYVILDEVHKVAEDLKSVSAQVTSLLTEWLQDGSLRGLIGFSGTASAYRKKFEKLGLHLVYTMPATDLIAYGFVAPFAEFGIPFAYSDREQRVRKSISNYKKLMKDFFELLDGNTLRTQFAFIPLEERLAVARDLLHLYKGRRDRDAALAKHLSSWETGGALKLNEISLVMIIQIIHGCSDQELARKCAVGLDREGQEAKRQQFLDLLSRLERVRSKLKEEMYLPDVLSRLTSHGFGRELDAAALRELRQSADLPQKLKTERLKDLLAQTVVGLYNVLKNFYHRVGEGRVDCIKSIIAAERRARSVNGIIVFDTGTPMRWQKGLAVPGYKGVGGVFGQILGTPGVTPLAVLSGEIYLPWHKNNPLSERIATFIKNEIMVQELGESFLNLVLHGLQGKTEDLATVRATVASTLTAYITSLTDVHARRPAEFEHQVLHRLRKAVQGILTVPEDEKLIGRLSLRHHHLGKWVATFYDYAMIVSAFTAPHTGELQQVNGKRQQFLVVTMAQGERKQLMYDLTARIIDAESLPFNMIIVSTWARTGWNVIRPNVLIDATATRNVTAWQQLRGRAMRAMRTWNNDCYGLVMLLLGSHPHDSKELANLPPDVLESADEFQQAIGASALFAEKHRDLLQRAHQEAASLAGISHLFHSDHDELTLKIGRKDCPDCLSKEEKLQLAVELLLTRNKVTHIYEMVKAYGTPQVRLDLSTKTWGRTQSIAAKHRRQYGVHPISGVYGSGEAHAPLIYAGDPRTNLPAKLRRLLLTTLLESDPLIVKGWLETALAESPPTMGR
ncbi:MAG: DEAD/DEAH box helicase family protein [Proteobacteria bacterium]|nr:DEAD/DEAH box helicase family protein [Pseudomonadota bacterium]MBU1058259.1 DEAD/DEAH box helicase family protein [Pseudomonadota bacterium]